MAPEHWTSQELLARHHAGDKDAASELFDRYMTRLTSLARAKLSPRLAARTDPEDVVMSAWRSFFAGASEGRFALSRSGDLWRLLVQITLHKLYHQARRHRASTRSVSIEQPLETIDSWLTPADDAPAPEDVVAVAEQLELLMAGLDALGRRVLELRLQGEQLQEIAAEAGCSERTVRRILAGVRQRMLLQLGREHDDGDELDEAPEVARPRPRSSRWQPAASDVHAPLEYGDFQLQRLIGAGRVGKVYRAWQKSQQRLVAVKHIRKSFLTQPDVVARFVAEWQTVARLHHPGIIGVQGLGRTPAGGYFIAMELVDGCDLAQRMKRGPIAIPDAIDWIRQACEALDHAHRQGTVHCDLKPANLLLGLDGRIRVTDFGLARSAMTDGNADERIEGTAPFMSPEQISSIWGKIGPRTDVYGLGAVLYTLLTGHPPFNGKRLADVMALVISAARAPDPRVMRPEIPDSIGELCLRCLAKEAALRFQSAAELQRAISDAVCC